MKHVLPFLALFAATPVFAEDTRHLDAHEHGVGVLNIAIDGSSFVMEFHAPGADIVGFEYEARSETDHAAIEAAIALLGAPLDLFALPDAAGCTVTSATAELEGEEGHDDHEDHDDGHNDDHADEAGHTEFHAEYALDCDAPDALTQITFAYFDTFPNAKEVEVQMVTSSGAQAFEVERDTPVLDLGR